MLQSVRVRNVAERVRLLDEKAEALEPVREAVVGQQLQRAAAAGELVDRRRPDAVLLRQLPGGDRRPHRFGRRRVERRQVPTAPASRIRPKFGSRPSAVAPVMRSSDAGVDRDDGDARRTARRGAESSGASIGRASSTGGDAAPAQRERRGDRRARRSATNSDAQTTARVAARCRRSSASTQTQDRGRAPAPSRSRSAPSRSRRRARARTSTRFAHISAAPAAAASAPATTSTPTLIHAGENTSRASSCRSTSRM